MKGHAVTKDHDIARGNTRWKPIQIRIFADARPAVSEPRMRLQSVCEVNDSDIELRRKNNSALRDWPNAGGSPLWSTCKSTCLYSRDAKGGEYATAVLEKPWKRWRSAETGDPFELSIIDNREQGPESKDIELLSRRSSVDVDTGQTKQVEHHFPLYVHFTSPIPDKAEGSRIGRVIAHHSFLAMTATGYSKKPKCRAHQEVSAVGAGGFLWGGGKRISRRTKCE
ncbi:hypothetical protein BJV78DRAFT_1150564 [Lactifluus subvellereus]|nr:hypothetical protein BJV78DRAFT_1150564 [Lactifluus subvellereus]